ncbi:fimbrial protein [Pantoea ananatis]|uniref:fimbrial protein n=1 Tax=Pantoea ananas TaxID=553 RepID=UPI003FA457D2
MQNTLSMHEELKFSLLTRTASRRINRMRNWSWTFLFGVIFWSIATDVKAFDCNKLTSGVTVTPPDLIIQKDLPVGSPIGQEIVSGVVPIFNCSDEPGPAITKQEFGVKGLDYVMTLHGRRIYSTNIPGIGYAIGITSVSNCGNTLFVDGYGSIDGDPNNRLVCVNESSKHTNQPITAQARIQFYKTAQNTGSGSLEKSMAGAFILRNQGNYLLAADIRIGRFNVKTIGCSVLNTVIAVPMGKVEKRAFGGKGTWPGDANTREFKIDLNCDLNTKIYFRIDGSAMDASKGILTLSGGNGSATGVGIQLLFKDKPLPLTEEVDNGIANDSSNSYLVPLKARYYQTGGTITPGTANATATFTIINR